MTTTTAAMFRALGPNCDRCQRPLPEVVLIATIALTVAGKDRFATLRLCRPCGIDVLTVLDPITREEPDPCPRPAS